MHTKNFRPALILILFLFAGNFSLFGQQDTGSSVTVSASADVFSKYIWRGQDYGHTPSLQPGLSASWHDFVIGAWGAYRLSGDGDDELDFYLTKTVGPVSLSIWDYWSYSKSNPSKYFNYNPETTSHLLEGQILLSGGEKLPFNILGSWLFYGADPSKSIYVELQYVQPINNSQLTFFAGYQVKGNYYAPGRGFVNMGVTLVQPMASARKYSMDLLLSLIANPENKSVFFTVGLSLYNN